MAVILMRLQISTDVFWLKYFCNFSDMGCCW